MSQEEVIALIERRICFDAMECHSSLEERRKIYPDVVGYCDNHGGKCSDLLELVRDLRGGKVG